MTKPKYGYAHVKKSKNKRKGKHSKKKNLAVFPRTTQPTCPSHWIWGGTFWRLTSVRLPSKLIRSSAWWSTKYYIKRARPGARPGAPLELVEVADPFWNIHDDLLRASVNVLQVGRVEIFVRVNRLGLRNPAFPVALRALVVIFLTTQNNFLNY